MDTRELQKHVEDVFTKAFGNTPLCKRLEDIEGEARELCKFTDLRNLKEEAGDLLASTIMLCVEAGWDIDEVVKNTTEKIERRIDQYKSLGRKTNVAILGGAFDPITKGHIEIAKLILDASKWADEVWLMPANLHMSGKNMAPFEHRFNMCKIAAEVDGRIKVSSYEFDKNFKGESYHLLNTLIHDKNFENYRFAFVVGQDNANKIHTWYNSEELLKLDVKFIVVPRRGVKRDPSVTWYLQKPHLFIADENRLKYQISSTMVRTAMTDGDICVIDSCLDANVHKYILTNLLYV